eukprot:TRINITY_DN1806_c2_g1_i2.p1 TRINITY_DN1806_c2_g1~~TRINITY_DN1806_c2_g1_i2.p1  ORF type:complete len:1041 (+),score=168.07 TRINITY_DN1806_c2_g1_i2:59-3124(+)
MEEKKPDDYYDRYSRQFYVIGAKAMNSMGKASVLISGLDGLGVEIAKNVILAGPKRVVLHDTKNASLADLSTQYYLSEEYIGQNRAVVSSQKLGELNPYVKLEVTTDNIFGDDLSYLANFQSVVLVGASLSTQLRVNDFCHSKNIAFIVADTYGLFAWSFVDFGKNFIVHDKNGEFAKEVFVAGITQSTDAEVTTLDDQLHDLETGDIVKFTELEGMTPLNWVEGSNEVSFKITVTSPKSFKIGIDTTGYPPYVSGGLAVELKDQQTIHFKPLVESLKSPDFLESDFSKLGRSTHLHIAMQALHKYKEQNDSLPRPWDADDAEMLLAIAKSLDSSIDDDLVRKFAYTSSGSFVPITASIGGFVSQEVLKSITGKFTPLNQWFYFDALEVLNLASSTEPSNFQPIGNRYDSQIICIGRVLHQKLQNARIFMVGSGAIGCEMLKNYAMLGIGTSQEEGEKNEKRGLVTVTDNDIIEKSNLNRQFLFRDGDIRSSKSVSAARAVKTMNPAINIHPNLDKVETSTESKYDDAFFATQHAVVNALDNLPARLYVDSRCVTNCRPLIESGTMGTKGHVQVVLPYLTENYGAHRDPPERDVPYCTIRSFPSTINHTIEWAREKFQDMFVTKPKELLKFVDDKTQFIDSISGNSGPQLKCLKYILKMTNHPITTFEQCIRYARRKFERLFKLDILQLLHKIPADKKNNDGTLFWTLPKRPPTVQEFDPNNKLHMDFIWHTSALIAHIFRIKVSLSSWSSDSVSVVCSSVVDDLPVFKIKGGDVLTDESVLQKPEEEEKNLDTDVFETVVTALKAANPLSVTRPVVEEFEKDDDNNHHVDFITQASNLRATAYKITPADRMETKRIAGRIIPAIATTTACVSGLASLELVKVLANSEKRKLEDFKNTFLNLGLPVFAMSEPAAAKKMPIAGTTSFYTIWDSWEIRTPEITLEAFIQHFKQRFNLIVNGVFKDVHTLYMSLFPQHEKRLPLKLRELDHIRGLTDDYVDLTVTFELESGEDVDGPAVRFYLK